VWFTTGTLGSPNFAQLGQLGLITPDGAVTLTTFPEGAIPGQIAAGPQGTLWALSETRIWKITVN
jgi:streptogramin lyase